MSEKEVGFFEESAGVRSSTRLFTQELIVLAAVLVLGALSLAFWGPSAGKPAIVGILLGGAFTSLISAVIAIVNRS